MQRSISLARWAHSSKPAGAGFAAVAHAGTDERTPYCYIDPALHTIYGQCQIKAIQMRGFARTAAVSLIFRSPTWSIFRGVARTSSRVSGRQFSDDRQVVVARPAGVHLGGWSDHTDIATLSVDDQSPGRRHAPGAAASASWFYVRPGDEARRRRDGFV